MTTTRKATAVREGTLDQLLQSIIRRIKRDKAVHAMVGPIVLDNADAPYFVLATGIQDGACHIEQLKAQVRSDAEALRNSLFMSIMTECRPLVMHDFDDELQMAKSGEALWPARFASIRASIEAERQAAQ
jgi:hypothetical protein